MVLALRHVSYSQEIVGFVVKSVHFSVYEALFCFLDLIFLEIFSPLVDKTLVAVVVFMQMLLAAEIRMFEHRTVVF